MYSFVFSNLSIISIYGLVKDDCQDHYKGFLGLNVSKFDFKNLLRSDDSYIT